MYPSYVCMFLMSSSVNKEIKGALNRTHEVKCPHQV